jgi:hypothetical protein
VRYRQRSRPPLYTTAKESSGECSTRTASLCTVYVCGRQKAATAAGEADSSRKQAQEGLLVQLDRRTCNRRGERIRKGEARLALSLSLSREREIAG